MTNDPRELQIESLRFTKCQDDTECLKCDKLEWCGNMETHINILIDRVRYSNDHCINCQANQRGDEYTPGSIVEG